MCAFVIIKGGDYVTTLNVASLENQETIYDEVSKIKTQMSNGFEYKFRTPVSLAVSCSTGTVSSTGKGIIIISQDRFGYKAEITSLTIDGVAVDITSFSVHDHWYYELEFNESVNIVTSGDTHVTIVNY